MRFKVSAALLDKQTRRAESRQSHQESVPNLPTPREFRHGSRNLQVSQRVVQPTDLVRLERKYYNAKKKYYMMKQEQQQLKA